MVIELSTSANRVGSTNHPVGEVRQGRRRRCTSRAPFCLALLDVAEHPVLLARRDERTHQVRGVGRVAVGARSRTPPWRSRRPRRSGRGAPAGGSAWRSPDRRGSTRPTTTGCAAARSASSSTRLTDLPPSSRNTGFRVSAAAAMIRRPVAVEPVKAIMSTSATSVSTSPTRWSDEVTTLTTPGGDVGLLGDQSAEAGGVPRSVGRRLEHARVAHRQDRSELVEDDLDGEVPGDDHTDDADRLLPHLALGLVPMPNGSLGPSERRPRELVDHLGRPGQRLAQRCVELRAVGDEDRATDLGDQLGAQLLLLGLDGGLQLEEAVLAEGVVDRPVGGVERRRGPRRSRPSCRRSVPSATWPRTSSVAGLTLSKSGAVLCRDQLACR